MTVRIELLGGPLAGTSYIVAHTGPPPEVLRWQDVGTWMATDAYELQEASVDTWRYAFRG